MLIITNRGFKRRYGGTGIFDTLTKLVSRLASSNIAKQLTSAAVEVGKDAVVNVGKRLTQKGIEKLLPSPALTQQSAAIIQKYTEPAEGSGKAMAIQDLVKRLNGSGIKII